MKIEISKNGFSILVNGKLAIEHSRAIPLIRLGRGKAGYVMERGAFNIWDRVVYSCDLTEFALVGQVSNSVVEAESVNIRMWTFNSKESVLMNVSEKAGILEISFEEKPDNLNWMWINVLSNANEHIYGCGEQFTDFDLKGKRVRVWVAEHQNLKRIKEKFLNKRYSRWNTGRKMDFEKYETYYAQPTYITSKKNFVHVDSSAFMEFDFSRKSRSTLHIREIPSKIYFGNSNDFEELFEKLSSVLGRQPLLPKWVYNGAILGIQGGTQIMLDKVDAALLHGMKVAGVWCQDWQGRRVTAFGKQLMWNWKWDEVLYPELDKKIWELRERQIRFMGYINPFLAIEGQLYKDASKMGYMVKNRQGKDYYVTITTFPAAMLDLTNPDACRWIKDVIKTNMIDFGLSGWMADFGEYLPVDAVLWSGEDAEILHNEWPAIWARINREAIEEAGVLGDVVFFTRAGYTGNVRYSTLMWSGDQHVDFSMDDGLPSVIPSMLSLSVCGFGLSHSDIGGYTSLYKMTRTKEVFMRWAEMSAFTPVMRNHEGNRPDTNVQFDADDEILDFYAKFSRVYAAISPYIEDIVAENALKGIPTIRPIFMYYDEEWAYEEKYQYLFGRDLLVAPVLKAGALTWRVELPVDSWVHLWSGREYGSGIFDVDAPIGQPPVFYRKHSRYLKLFEGILEI